MDTYSHPATWVGQLQQEDVLSRHDINQNSEAVFKGNLDGLHVMAHKNVDQKEQTDENGNSAYPGSELWTDTIPPEGNDDSEKAEGSAENITKLREQHVGDIASEAELLPAALQDPKVLEILYKRSSTADTVNQREEIHHFINPADYLRSRLSSANFYLSSQISNFAYAPSNSPYSGEYSGFDITDPTILEFEYHKQLAINAQNLKSILATQVDVLEIILPYLSLQEVLTCRLICKKWCDVISSLYFWKRVHVTRLRGGKVTWTDLINSDLCNVYKCPSYHIVECDLRESEVRLFFEALGSQIKNLKLTRCVYSVATLQNLFTKLHSLDHLEITGVDPSVLVSESIFLPYQAMKAKNLRTLPVLKLTTLVLEYHIGRKDLQLEQSAVVSFIPRNLGEDVLHDLLSSSCEHLKIIKLIGWESRTCFNLLQQISYNLPSRPTSLEELHFLNVSLENLSFADFYPLANPFNSLRLKKLSICLANNYWRCFPTVDTVYVDKIVTEILQVQNSSLTRVYLDHCPVSAKVFTVKMPKLKKMSIHGTKISVADMSRISGNFDRRTVTAVTTNTLCEACVACSEKTSIKSMTRACTTLHFWGAVCCCAMLLYTIVLPDQPRLLLFFAGMMLVLALTIFTW